MTTVIPSKGQYKGMKLLMRALRQTEQYEVLSLLEKTYDEEVDAIISKKPETNLNTGAGYPIQATVSDCDSDSVTSAMLVDNVRSHRNLDSLTRSISNSKSLGNSSSDEYDDDDVISLDSPIEQQPKTPDNVISPPNSPVQQQSAYYDVNVRLPCNGGATTVTVTSSPPSS